MNSTESNFHDKVALITGSSSGMGAATALHFAKLGAKVVVNGSNASRVSSVAEQCRKVGTNAVLEVVADLQDDNHVKGLVQKTVDTFGKIDILVNCAGMMVQKNIVDPEYVQAFDRVVRLNLRSVVFVTSLVVPFLQLTKGCVVNVSSISSVTPWKRTWGAYGLTKCGIDMLTKCLAMELGRSGVRVNSILPGIIITPMVLGSSYSREQIDQFCQMEYPLGRPGEVDEIARAIEFLASDNSSFITGISMPIDGGAIIGRRSRL